ncbi:ribosomal large subunit pseudouridine synthase B-like isoform X2 [Labrus mixtus]|uniref:ribosomal large subunit pseudouridine synthase B-like isoform X2 n=1 Tax=Labrus mixtus TaxID=508554 RepID=UPI0029C0A59A|nr:ribosomal large subunit pseudouridine synthase B-like isoform X2 [Labrus mixtus]
MKRRETRESFKTSEFESLHLRPEDYEGTHLRQTAVPSIGVNKELESVLDPRIGAKQRLKQTNMEGRNCCVKNCRRFSHDQLGRKIPNGLTFHCFPCWRKNEGNEISALTMRRRAAWVAAVGRGNITFSHIPTSMRVCSRHFHSGKPAYEMLESDPDWVPSLELGHSEGDDRHTELLLKPEKPKGEKKLKKTTKKTSSVFRPPEGGPEPAAAGGGSEGEGKGGGGGQSAGAGQRKRVKRAGITAAAAAAGGGGGEGGVTAGGGGGITTGGGGEGGITAAGGGGEGGITTGGGEGGEGGITAGGGGEGGITAGGGEGGITTAGGGGPVRAAVYPWREAKSLLQSILKPEPDVRQRPADETHKEMELPPKEAGFRDFFRESLRASLEVSSRSWTLLNQQTISLRPLPEKESSSESCMSCERLQRSVTVLQEELTRHTTPTLQPDQVSQSPETAHIEEEVPDYVWSFSFRGGAFRRR